jgi:LytS/YehU family sensor histidine kinase
MHRENTLKLTSEKQQREVLEMEMAEFKNDINPDLLYESLENLILTIHHNTDQAEEQIDYLAGIYRYSLVNRQKEIVAFDDEWRAASNLVSLLNYHHHGQLNMLSDNFSRDGISLVPGSLMIAIDSIIRNTLISRKSPLVLRIYLEEEDDYLVLQHTINDKLLLHHESINAFTRLQRSYSFFSDKPFVQVKAGKENYIKFPIIRVTNQQEA